MSKQKAKSGADLRPVKCPCGSGAMYADCCGRLHRGETPATDTPEALMRSRYAAFVLGLSDYLRATWAPQHRPPAHWAPEPGVKWLGLKVVSSTVSTDGNHGTVEFIARSRVSGRGHRHHETSRFERHGERWMYVDGDVH